MKRKGFINFIPVLIIGVIIGLAAYFVTFKPIKPSFFNPNLSGSPAPSATSEPTSNLTPTPSQFPQNNNGLSVLDLTGNKEAYVGKRVRVQGRITINVSYSERPCLLSDTVCDTSMGAKLELWQPNTSSGAENVLLLFKNNQPYPCSKTSPGVYACSTFIDKQITTIEGVWKKDQVATQWVGSSGGKPATPVKWADRYFLNIE